MVKMFLMDNRVQLIKIIAIEYLFNFGPLRLNAMKVTLLRRWRFIKVWLKDQVFRYVSRAKMLTDRWMLFVSILSLLVVVYDFGFYTSPSWKNFTEGFFPIVFLFFFIVYVVRILFFRQMKTRNFRRFLDYLLCFLLFFSADISMFHPRILLDNFPGLSFFETRFYYHGLVIFIFILELSKGTLNIYRIRFNPSLLYAGSFFFLIVIGTGLLMLPRSTAQELDFVDAVFTATSAVCVTGLIVVDTATHFSGLGQGIIMLLFQIGGLGVMIFTSFFGFFFQGAPSFQNQIFLKDFVNEDKLGRIVRTLYKILGFALMVEIIGAVLIFSFQSQTGLSLRTNIWHALFHSVSAFCNAGFSVFTNGMNDAENGTFQNYHLHLVVSFLIVLGGIGFPVVLNYFTWMKNNLRSTFDKLYKKAPHHRNIHLINVNTRIVTYTTLALLVLGTLGFWLLEKDNLLDGMSFYGKFVTSFFGAVTPRTAGFNTVDTSAMLIPTVMLTIFLMWVGASPSSCGGGIKTSTLALAISNIISMARGKPRIDLFHRHIADENIRRAFAIIILSVLFIGMGVFLLSITDGHLGMKAIVFESFSAFSTVGLSLGITADLSNPGKVIISCLMFTGRIGTLTIVVAFFRKLSSYNYQYPNEQIYIN